MSFSKSCILKEIDTVEDLLTKKTTHKPLTRAAFMMCFLGILFYFYEYYLRVAPSVMSAELKQTFMINDAAFGFLAACYYYAYTPMQIPVGMMMDKFGPRRMLTFACILCAIGTYLFAETSSLFLAQFSRFIIGFGSAFAYVGFLKITNIWLPKRYFAMMAGICSALGMLGGISGQLTMAYFVETLGWQTTLYYAAVVGVILSLALWFLLRDGPKVSVSSLKVEQQPKQIGILAGLTQMLTSSQMWINGLIGCFTYLPISGFAEVWAVTYLETVGFSRQSSALGSSMVFLGFAIGGPIWGWVSDAIGSRRYPLIIGSFISAILMAWVIWWPSQSYTLMYIILFLTGFFASCEILIFAIGNDLSDSSVSATAVAFTNMLTMVGGAFLPPIIGKFLDMAVLKSGTQLPTVFDYSIALTSLPVSLVLAGILSFLLKETYSKHHH